LPPKNQSTKQFDALKSMPVGRDWNTGDDYKRLIQPELLSKAGCIIKPLKHKVGISMDIVEKLIEHREKRSNIAHPPNPEPLSELNQI